MMKLDRSAIMRDAHLRFRQGKRLNLGWSFSQCLSTAWAAAKQHQRDIETFKRAPIIRRVPSQRFPVEAWA